MLDITAKSDTLRVATAEAVVLVQPETLQRMRAGEVPKGDVAMITKATGLLAIKRTPDILPFCHPIPILHGDVRTEFELEENQVRVTVEVATIARTGVEVEAMTAAAIAALNVYDMVKPIDKTAHIKDVKLLKKRGGKSDFRNEFDRDIRAAVIVCSDSVSAGSKTDSAGKAIKSRLKELGLVVAVDKTLPDEPDQIAAAVIAACDDDGVDLLFTVGGTGLSPRDRTPEAVGPVLERRIDGIDEAIRSYGRQRTPYADLSRAIAGQRGTTLVVTLPGSTRGAGESLDALMPWALHIIKVFDKAYRHDQ